VTCRQAEADAFERLVLMKCFADRAAARRLVLPIRCALALSSARSMLLDTEETA